MSLVSDQKFSFVSKALSEDTFTVVAFKGSEGLSTLYQFEINLISTEKNVDLKEVLQHPACLTIHRKDGDVPIQGIPVQFELHQAFDKYAIYRVILAPKFWWLTLTRHNQVFLNKTLPDIFKAVLEECGLTSQDYDLKLQGSYPELEYVCQYQESHYHFLCRWMEREGIYYFFDHSDSGEKLVLVDQKSVHSAMSQGEKLTFHQPSGLEQTHQEEIIRSLICRQVMIPQKVLMKDYNYATPSLDLKVEANVDTRDGRGEVYAYGDYFRTKEVGKHLAQIRAEGYLAKEQEFIGESTVPYVRSGYLVEIEKHFRDDFNQKYLVAEVQHQGTQVSYMAGGLRKILAKAERKEHYQNVFTAIPAATQFRAEHQTPKPRFHGTLHAMIDASGSGQYAQVDDDGRYKVILPFDLSGRKDGKASCWVRKMEPYGGDKHGFHFPLNKGTEVLLIFTDGDPDRPIIAGVTPNPEHPSLISSKNENMAMLTTLGQNLLHFYDQKSKQAIHLECPTDKSGIYLGDKDDSNKEKGITISTQGQLNEDIKDKIVINGQNDLEQTIKGDMTITGQGKLTETITKAVEFTAKDTLVATVDKKNTANLKSDNEITVDGTSSVTIKGKNTIDAKSDENYTVSGTRTLKVDGDYKETVQGALDVMAFKASSDTYLKDYTLMVAGNKKSLLNKHIRMSLGSVITGFMGAQINMSMAAQLNLCTALVLALNLSGAININAGATVSVYAGIKLDVRGGPAFKIESSPVVDIKAAPKVNMGPTEIEMVGLKMIV